MDKALRESAAEQGNQVNQPTHAEESYGEQID
jgi:hypothetical protein